MAVKSIESQLIMNNAMLQNNGWSVVLYPFVVVQTINHAIQRCIDWGAGFHEEINAKVDCTCFGAMLTKLFEHFGSINRACFVVLADADTGVGSAYTLKQAMCESYSIGEVRLIPQLQATYA